jgi:hypothetical protein
MPRRFSGSPIAVSFSTHGSWMPGWMAQHVAAVSGVAGLDVDAVSTVGAWLASQWGHKQPPYVQIRSIWIPYHGFQSTRTRRFVDELIEHQGDEPPLVIVTVPGTSNLRALARDLDHLRTMADTWPLGIGLASSSLKGGRPHLVQLGGFRRFAEEWDLTLAIDLSGSFDPTWEAEAAIARLGDRLGLIRLRASAPSRTAVGQDRVACRALHAAIDRSRAIDVATCSAHVFPFPTTPRAAAQSTRRAADYVEERTALHAEALREGIDHFEGSKSPRGN